MTPTTTDRLAEVLDCDREAAWAFRPAGYGPMDRQYWGNGSYDGNRVLQAFARHRIAATQPLSTDLDKAQQQQLVDDRPEITGSPEAKISTYNDMHEIAAELGFPSILEALEYVSEAQQRLAKKTTR